MTFTNADLSYMRDTLEQMLPDTGNILSVTRTSDGIGGFSEAWGTTTTGVSCRLDHKRGMKTVTGGALVPFSEDVLTVAYDTTITTGNRFEHGSETYTVTDVDIDKSWPIIKRCILERVP